MKLAQINDKKLLNQQTINTRKKIATQQGAVLIIFMLVLMLSAVTYLVGGLDTKSVALDREKQTQAALAEAKIALIGYAFGVSNLEDNLATTLPNPDMGNANESSKEGYQALNIGATDFNLIGKLPWYGLDSQPIKDGWDECLWYAVSGRFKHNPDTAVLNWDTQGQIDVIDENGNKIATNLAALVIAPGPVISGQNRSSGQVVYPQCGGNYDVKNYLDTPNISKAISWSGASAVNYYEGSQNSGIAASTQNKTFVMASNANYNDRFAFITVDDIFNRIIFRKDFKDEISKLLNTTTFNIIDDITGKLIADPQGNLITSNLASVTKTYLTGNNGTDRLKCPTADYFCRNWFSMFFVKDYVSSLAKVSFIDATPASTIFCSRVIIFGGKKNAVGDYLDGQNKLSFYNSGTIYEGSQNFDPKNPTQDVIKCVP